MINEGFAFLTVVSFLGWVGLTLLFIFKAFGKNGEFYPKPAMKIGAGIVVCYALWIIGMLKA